MTSLTCDYLVVGGGAAGMAFVDELIHHSKDLTVVMVDRRAKPGGHWVDAYEFVRLHQPAAYYGVNSRPLENNQVGGGADLASKAQILAYYELVLADLKATGRLTWLPLCEHKGNGRLVSLTQAGKEIQVTVRKKTVDATRMETRVPSTTKPNFAVEDGVNIVPVNGLSRLSKPWARYVVIGAGKTGLDALLQLLDTGVSQDSILWVVSQDCWYFNRDSFTDETVPLSKAIPKLVADINNAMLNANSFQDIYHALEKDGDKGVFMRLDRNIEPTKNRAATVSSKEMARFREIQNLVRQGRIEKITEKEMIFANGHVIPAQPETLYIDCSAPSTGFGHPKVIFSGDTINIQMVILPQPCYSASIIAALELKYPEDEEKKNQVIPIGINHEKAMQWDPEAYWILTRDQTLNAPIIGKLLGLNWMRRSRLSAMKYFGTMTMIKIIFSVRKIEKPMIENLSKMEEAIKEVK